MTVEQGKQGERGERGERGETGRRGVDSMEPLTRVLGELRDELVGVRLAVQTERRGRRFSLAVMAAAMILAALVSVSVFADARSNQLGSDRSEWDQQVQLHDSCLRANESRASIRDAFTSFYDLLSVTVASQQLTPEDRATVNMFVAEGTASLAESLPEIDCDTESPLPEGERP